MTRTILHMDMDAFYASVEQRDRPELRGQPVIVGAPPDQRGVVSTCSYEARRFGVHSAMPSRTAFQRCPHAIFLPPNMALYESVSQQIRDILQRFTPDIEPLSCDEAFLDVTGAIHLFGDGPAIARQIKTAIRDELRLTCSIGVAPNKFLAKLASELQKPDGLTCVPVDPGHILAFLAPLAIQRLWGVGQTLAQTLRNAGFDTIGDLQRADTAMLYKLIGPATTHHLLALARGQDDRPVETHIEEQSLSREHTFLIDTSDVDELTTQFALLAEDVAFRLRRIDRLAGVVKIKLRFDDFTTITRQRTLAIPAADDFTLHHAGLELLLREFPPRKPVRLIGCGVASLLPRHDGPGLLLLDEDAARQQKRETLCDTLDKLNEHFGAPRVRRGFQ